MEFTVYFLLLLFWSKWNCTAVYIHITAQYLEDPTEFLTSFFDAIDA